jgi:hypothetical protein
VGGQAKTPIVTSIVYGLIGLVHRDTFVCCIEFLVVLTTMYCDFFAVKSQKENWKSSPRKESPSKQLRDSSSGLLNPTNINSSSSGPGAGGQGSNSGATKSTSSSGSGSSNNNKGKPRANSASGGSSGSSSNASSAGGKSAAAPAAKEVGVHSTQHPPSYLLACVIHPLLSEVREKFLKSSIICIVSLYW